MMWRRNSISLFLTIICLSVFAQRSGIRVLSLDEGLPQASVYHMIQDTEGFLRIGTQGGLGTYDGFSFETTSSSSGLPDNHVTFVYQEGETEFWLGHRFEGISVLLGEKVVHIRGRMPGVPGPINEILKYNDQIWAASSNGGLFKFEKDFLYSTDTAIAVIPDSSKIGKEIKGLHIIDDKLYAITSRSIWEVNTKTNDCIKMILNGVEKTNILNDICVDGDGQTWLATQKGLFKLTPNEQGFDVIKTLGTKDGLPAKQISHLYWLPKGELWATSDSGAAIIFEDRIKPITTANGLSSNQVAHVMQDTEGTVWIGTKTGANHYLGAAFESIGKLEGLNANEVYAVAGGKNGPLWVGTGSGLNKVIFTDAHMHAVKSVEHVEFVGLKNQYITALYIDEEQSLWVGTRTGLFKYNTNINTWSAYSTKSNSFPFDFVSSISETPHGDIIVASRGNGCAVLHKDKTGTHRFTARFMKDDGIGSDVIWVLFRDSKKRLWFGSNDAGATVWDGQTFTRYDVAAGLTNKRPASISEDSFGNIWFGSIGGGVYKFDGVKFTNYNTDDGLDSNNPYLVHCDDIGNVWVGTNTGVDRLTISSNEIHHFGKEEGFLGIETNQNAKYKDGSGKLWLGTIKGVVRCDPNLTSTNKTPCVSSLQNIRVFLKNDTIPADHKYSYKNNHLTFDYVGISLLNAKGVRYSHRLLGYNAEWSPELPDRFATYSNITPGKYTFEVKTMNADRVWSEVPLRYSFEVIPPFWETLWFRMISIVICIAGVVGFIRLRTMQMKKIQAYLELQVDERTSELAAEKAKVEESYEEIQEQKEVIEAKNKDITDSIHYARSIQEAILPADQELTDMFPSSYVLYLPRDIVSGDFYWFHKKEKLSLIAVADCTGHGVPGAFMSVMGNDLLNQVISQDDVRSPGEALKRLDLRISETLSKQGEKKDLNDGMDIALVAYHRDSMKLQYSGAFRPLYLLRDGVVEEYKATKCSVGSISQLKVAFEDHEIQLQVGDKVYLFSDGFVDQFGGEKGKKFMRKRFNELILESSDLPFPQQKELMQKTFREWKGMLEQVDDVLVLGFEI